jgi:hypothetical protein
LATFYERLLGWTRLADEPAPLGAPPEDGWLMLQPPAGGTGLSFQFEPDYVRPTWPPSPGEPQMTMHLDIAVEISTKAWRGLGKQEPRWQTTNRKSTSA